MTNRNDPCSCGSGKKYKQCCYMKDRSQRHQHRADTEVEARVDADQPVYKLWEVVRDARNDRDYRLLFKLFTRGVLTGDCEDVEEFVAKAREGEIPLPGGPSMDLRRIVLPEQDAYLLLADDLTESGEMISVESWHCCKLENHWVIKAVTRQSLPRQEDFVLPSAFEMHQTP